ncbi:Tellurite resistance protein TehB [Klebsiella pneumoniae]|nr:Tellurite resistance protein TehB [Klebsiella pneumoniae]
MRTSVSCIAPDANGNRIKLRFATLLARKPCLIRRGVGS